MHTHSLISSHLTLTSQHYHPYPGIERDVISIIMKFHSTLQLFSYLSLGCDTDAAAYSLACRRCLLKSVIFITSFIYIPPISDESLAAPRAVVRMLSSSRPCCRAASHLIPILRMSLRRQGYKVLLDSENRRQRLEISIERRCLLKLLISN
jgi:hypothetical protein